MLARCVTTSKHRFVVRRYGPEGKFNGTLALSAMLTDFWFRCATEQFANAAQRANQSTFVYRCVGE